MSVWSRRPRISYISLAPNTAASTSAPVVPTSVPVQTSDKRRADDGVRLTTAPTVAEAPLAPRLAVGVAAPPPACPPWLTVIVTPLLTVLTWVTVFVTPFSTVVTVMVSAGLLSSFLSTGAPQSPVLKHVRPGRAMLAQQWRKGLAAIMISPVWQVTDEPEQAAPEAAGLVAHFLVDARHPSPIK